MAQLTIKNSEIIPTLELIEHITGHDFGEEISFFSDAKFTGSITLNKPIRDAKGNVSGNLTIALDIQD